MSILSRIKSRFHTISKSRAFIQTINKNGGRVLNGVKVKIIGDAKVGEDVVIGAKGIDLYERTQIVVTEGAKLRIGSHVGMTSVSIFCKDAITIEDYVNIGAGCLILDSNFHNTDWRVRENRYEDVTTAVNSPVNICNHAFIGARCIINKGVTIGTRSIIASGSVVVRDIPADCIAGGNPCKVIKSLK